MQMGIKQALGLQLNSVWFDFSMEHIRKNHVQRCNHKSYFAEGEHVQQLIQETLDHPLMVKRHVMRRNGLWYIGKYGRVIGYRGFDGSSCKYIVILTERSRLITAYPVPHPSTVRAIQH